MKVIVRSASYGVVATTAIQMLAPVPRPATGAKPRIGVSPKGSGLPGRFRNSESVTSSVFTSLPLGGEPREGFPLSGYVRGEKLKTVCDGGAPLNLDNEHQRPTICEVGRGRNLLQ